MVMPFSSFKNWWGWVTLLLPVVMLSSINCSNKPKGPFWVKEVHYVDKKKQLSSKERRALSQQLIELVNKQKFYLPDLNQVLRAACKLLYQEKGLVATITALERKGEIYVDLKVTIRDQVNLISAYRFYGQLTKRDKAWLKKNIKAKWLFPHHARFLKKKIKAYYNQQGYPDCVVRCYKKNQGKNNLMIAIHIFPNRLIRLAEVNYQALPLLPKKKGMKERLVLLYPRKKYIYQTLVAIGLHLMKGQFFISWKEFVTLFSFPAFDLNRLASEIKTLEQLYQEAGFLDLKICYRIEKKKKRVQLLLYPLPDSEKQYRYDQFKLKDPLPAEQANLEAFFLKKKGKPYNPSDNDKIVEALAKIYASQDRFIENSLIYTLFHDQKVELQIELQDKPFPQLERIRTKSIGLNQEIINHLLEKSDLLPGKKVTKKKLALLETLFRNSMRFEKLQFSYNQKVLEINLEPENALKYINLQGNLFSKIKLGGEMDNFDYKKLFQGKVPVGGGQKLSIGLITKSGTALLKGKVVPDIELLYKNPWILFGGNRFILESRVFQGTKKKEATHGSLKELIIESKVGYNWNNKLGKERELKLGGSFSRKDFDRYFINSQEFNQCYHILKAILAYSSQQFSHHFYPETGGKKSLKLVGSFNLTSDQRMANYLQAVGRWSFFKPFHLPLIKSCVMKNQYLAGITFRSSDRSLLGNLFLTDCPYQAGYSLMDNYSAHLPAAEQPDEEPKRSIFSYLLEFRYLPFLEKKLYAYLFFHTGIGQQNLLTLSSTKFSFQAAFGFGIRVETVFGLLELSFFWNVKENRPYFLFQIISKHLADV